MLLVRTAIAFLIFCGSAWAQASGNWLVDAKTQCKFQWQEGPHSAEEIYTYSSPHWTGACRNGMASGHGTFEFAVVWRFMDQPPRSFTQSGEGDFVDGKFTGKGFTSRRGPTSTVRYEGEFRDGLLNGKGIETRETATSLRRYEGDFIAGKKNGWAIEISEEWPKTSRERAYFWRYEGGYRDGEWSGKGVYVSGKKGCAVQEKYEGEYQGGRQHGRGTYRTIDGKTYTGVWNQGQLGNVATIQLHALAADIDKVCR